MYNKRFLLLGISILILGSGWMYPAKQTMLPAENDFPHSSIDTERVAGASAVVLTSANPQSYLFSELFLATSIGGSNGSRLNPKALNFIHDYVKENWEELQAVRM